MDLYAMDAWFLISATLLAVSGGAKLADPAPTSGALAAASLPSGRPWARLLGLVEIAVAVVAIAFGGVVGGVGVAVMYAGFAGFVAVALRRNLPVQSCGCFGKVDTPPTWLHVAVNLSAVTAGVGVAVSGGGALPDMLSGQPLAGLPYLVLLGVGVFALYLILAELPRLGRPVTGLPVTGLPVSGLPASGRP